MSEPAEIGFALVGTGAIAHVHAKVLREMPGVRLRAVYNRSFEKARAFAAEYGADAVSALPDLWRRDDVQVVGVTTPSGTHAEVAIPALEAGKHVLCEKPLDISLERVDAMIAASKRHGRILAAVFQSRFGDGARTVKRAVAAGRLGRRSLASAYVKWWRDQAYYDDVKWRGTWALDGGGALSNQGSHAVDLLQWLVGLPAEVSAFAATRAHQRIEAEDTLVASLRYGDGALGVIECATSCFPGTARRIELCGDAGAITLEDDRITRWEFAHAAPEDEAIRAGEQSSVLPGGSSSPGAIGQRGHRLQIEDLVSAIREGREPTIPGRDGRNAVRLIRAIYAAVQSGGTVTV